MKASTTSAAKCELSFTINDATKTVFVYPMERLLDVLRGQLTLTGPKEGCGEGECGSCSVLMDSVLVNSCLVPVLQASGTKIITREGLAEESRPDPLRTACLYWRGPRGGSCTP